MLKKFTQDDEDWSIRHMSLLKLTRDWKDDPDTLSILENLAQDDEHPAVRQTAVVGLARGWKDDPETLPMLKEYAQLDEHPAVRQTAVEELARGWKDDSNMYTFFCDVAVKDPFVREKSWHNNPQQTALEILFKLYQEHPRTLEVFLDRAEHDPDEQVRDFAKEHLEKLRLSS